MATKDLYFTPGLMKQLKRDEDTRFDPYLDCCGKYWRLCTCAVKGKLTIGTGRNLDDVGISQAEADQMLFNDMTSAMNGVYKFLPWATKLDDARLGVLGNMSFNMGIHNLLMFRNMLEALERGDYEQTAKEMENSRWYKQVGVRGVRLATQMRLGTWQ